MSRVRSHSCEHGSSLWRILNAKINFPDAPGKLIVRFKFQSRKKLVKKILGAKCTSAKIRFGCDRTVFRKPEK
jgi:hypothetical protein